MTIQFRPLARLQYVEIVDELAAVSPRSASRFQSDFEKALGRIDFFPKSWGKVTRRTRLFIMRRFHVGIFYCVEKKIVRITGVIDPRTDWQRAPRWWE